MLYLREGPLSDCQLWPWGTLLALMVMVEQLPTRLSTDPLRSSNCLQPRVRRRRGAAVYMYTGKT